MIWYQVQRKKSPTAPSKEAEWVTITFCETDKPAQFKSWQAAENFALNYIDTILAGSAQPEEIAITRHVTLPN